MEIEIKYAAETEEERKERLYKLGNILSNRKHSFLAMVVRDASGSYFVVDLQTGKNISPFRTSSLKYLADEYYEPTDVLVTKITAEVEE